MGLKTLPVKSVIIALLCLLMLMTFAAPAGALDYTGWDFDFNITPSTIDLGQTVNVSVHVYYFGNDSKKQPFTANAPGVTVTITSPLFSTMELTNDDGFLNYTVHPDLPDTYTYTATVIFQAEQKTKTTTLVVNPAPVSTPTPTPVATVTPSPTPAPASTPGQSAAAANETGTPTPEAGPVTAVPATPTPSPAPSSTPAATKTPSEMLSVIGTGTVLLLIGLIARKKQ